jgi:hypothetical protein
MQLVEALKVGMNTMVKKYNKNSRCDKTLKQSTHFWIDANNTNLEFIIKFKMSCMNIGHKILRYYSIKYQIKHILMFCFHIITTTHHCSIFLTMFMTLWLLSWTKFAGSWNLRYIFPSLHKKENIKGTSIVSLFIFLILYYSLQREEVDYTYFV